MPQCTLTAMSSAAKVSARNSRSLAGRHMLCHGGVKQEHWAYSREISVLSCRVAAFSMTECGEGRP